MIKADLFLDENFIQTSCSTNFFPSDPTSDTLQQVRGKTIKPNFAPIDFQSGGGVTNTIFSPFEI